MPRMNARRRRQVQCFGIATVLVALAGVLTQAQTPPPLAQNPVCARLEGQLAAIDRGAADPNRVEQLKRLEDTANKQQFDLDRLNAQARRTGCEGSGFFLFGGQPPHCGPINAQIQQMRASIDRTQAEMERLQAAGGERDGQRRALLVALAQNDCGAQYRGAVAAQPRGFLETLLGGIPIFGNPSLGSNPPNNNTIFGLPDTAQTSTFRTLCVRTCDGYYFPVSFATSQSRFLEDERACQRMCPAAEVALYAHRNPGEEVNQAVSMQGRPYTELPTAFRYRQEYSPTCGCRRAGESWAQALKNLENRSTLEAGDILVDEQRAKALSQPKVDAQGRPIKLDPRAVKPDPRNPASAGSDGAPLSKEGSAEPDRNRAVRSVGPPFLPAR
jgi:Protein of unknown function (DUF2865)